MVRIFGFGEDSLARAGVCPCAKNTNATTHMRTRNKLLPKRTEIMVHSVLKIARADRLSLRFPLESETNKFSPWSLSGDQVTLAFPLVIGLGVPTIGWAAMGHCSFFHWARNSNLGQKAAPPASATGL